MYIFLPRVYIQNMGNGNAFREQINTNTLKNEMEAKEELKYTKIRLFQEKATL